MFHEPIIIAEKFQIKYFQTPNMGNFVYQLGASNEATKEGKVIHRMFWHMGWEQQIPSAFEKSCLIIISKNSTHFILEYNLDQISNGLIE